MPPPTNQTNDPGLCGKVIVRSGNRSNDQTERSNCKNPQPPTAPNSRISENTHKIESNCFEI